MMKLPPLAIALVVITALLGGCGDAHSDEKKQQGAAEPAEQRENGAASIEEFGSEASGSERAAVIGAFRGYLHALAVEDLPAACSLLAAQTWQSLQAYAGGKPGLGGCVASLSKLMTPSAPRSARLQAEGSVSAVRIEGPRGFVVFHAPGAKLFQQPMVREAGGWKQSTVVASVLIPSAATLGR
jgi:hypothetical protein